MKLRLILNLFLITTLSFNVYSQNIQNFSFVYSQGKNQLDSKKNIFTKDMVLGEPVQFRMKLTKNENKLILNKLNEIDFWSYPDQYIFESANESDLIGSRTPCFGRSMSVVLNSKIKTVKWNDCTNGKSKNRMHEKLIELDYLLIKIFTQKKEYKNSPSPLGAYQ